MRTICLVIAAINLTVVFLVPPHVWFLDVAAVFIAGICIGLAAVE